LEPNQARLFGKQVLRHVVDDIAQPRMRGLVVKPSRPDHGGFDRFGRTVFVDRLVEARSIA